MGLAFRQAVVTMEERMVTDGWRILSKVETISKFNSVDGDAAINTLKYFELHIY